MRHTLIWVFCLLVSMPVAAADGLTVQDLYDNCKDERATLSEGFCLGYLLGLTHGFDNSRSPSGGRYICDRRYTAGALRQQFRNWAEANPQHWSKNLASGAMSSVFELWGCPGVTVDVPD